jgi:hypothetical protein
MEPLVVDRRRTGAGDGHVVYAVVEDGRHPEGDRFGPPRAVSPAKVAPRALSAEMILGRLKPAASPRRLGAEETAIGSRRAGGSLGRDRLRPFRFGWGGPRRSPSTVT